MADVAASQLELPEDMMYDSEEEDGASGQWACAPLRVCGGGPSNYCVGSGLRLTRRCRTAELVAALHLATYVPLQVVKTFVERRRSLTQPVKEHFPATVLFADISGFTKLAGTPVSLWLCVVHRLSPVVVVSCRQVVEKGQRRCAAHGHH